MNKAFVWPFLTNTTCSTDRLVTQATKTIAEVFPTNGVSVRRPRSDNGFRCDSAPQEKLSQYCYIQSSTVEPLCAQVLQDVQVLSDGKIKRKIISRTSIDALQVMKTNFVSAGRLLSEHFSVRSSQCAFGPFFGEENPE